MANWTELNWETWEFLNWQKPLVVAINWHNGASGDSSVFSCLRHRPRYNTTNIIPTTTINSFSYYTHTHTSSHFDFLPALWPSLLKRDLLCVRLRTVELSPGHTVVLNSSITVRPWIISVAWRQPTNPRALHCTALTEWEKGNLKIGHGGAVPGWRRWFKSERASVIHSFHPKHVLF